MVNIEKHQAVYKKSNNISENNKPICVLSSDYQPEEHRIRNLEVYEDDIWIVTYPRSGKYNIMKLNQFNQKLKKTWFDRAIS